METTKYMSTRVPSNLTLDMRFLTSEEFFKWSPWTGEFMKRTLMPEHSNSHFSLQ